MLRRRKREGGGEECERKKFEEGGGGGGDAILVVFWRFCREVFVRAAPVGGKRRKEKVGEEKKVSCRLHSTYH